MKFYVSVDIEGVTGCTHWDETELSKQDCEQFRRQMTAEAKAACEGINEVFTENVEIFVKDSHDSGRNIIIDELPENVKLIRGWTSDPNSMIGGIDSSFDAALFVGYHSGASQNGNPLSHTMHTTLYSVKVNGVLASEYLLHTYGAAHMNIPVVFLSGDKMLCENAKKINPNIETVAVKEGLGNSTINLNPKYACKLIKEKVKKSLSKIESNIIELPEKFEVEVTYKNHYSARRASFYPGVEQTGPNTVSYTVDNARDMMITNFFIL